MGFAAWTAAAAKNHRSTREGSPKELTGRSNRAASTRDGRAGREGQRQPEAREEPLDVEKEGQAGDRALPTSLGDGRDDLGWRGALDQGS